MDRLGEMGLIGANDGSGLIAANARENELERDNFEAGSGSGKDQHATGDKSSKERKHNRHSASQIQELESAFKENPNPDETARLDLGRRLGMEGKQVKVWFQNRRAQVKIQLERHENSTLKQEIDKLHFENNAMKEAMRNPMCETCGSPAILEEISSEERHLMMENEHLKDELNRINARAGKLLRKDNSGPMTPMARHGSLPVMPRNGPGLTMVNVDVPNSGKSLLLDLASAAMDELLKLGLVDGPMWFRSSEGDVEMLNLEEYAKSFSRSIGPKPSGFVTEATRASGTVMHNGVAIVEALMDLNQWAETFPANIGTAQTVSVISAGVSGHRNGALQLVQAELQSLSAMVPVRQVKFIRFCKQCREDLWAVVDLSADFLLRGNASRNCRRLPSGCIVQALPNNGCSKVTWIEHTEYDETVIPNLCRPLVRLGLAFGARKWLADLRRRCGLTATVASSMSPNADHAVPSGNGTTSIVKLAQRMIRSFCMGISATVHSWEVVPNTDDVTLLLRKSTGDFGEPSGLILSATMTIWLPLTPQNLFEFLQNENNRHLWDILCREATVQKMLHIPKGRENHGTDSAISVLRANVTDPAANRTNVVILQDTCFDSSGSLVVYAAVESTGMNMVMSGGESSNVVILPSGFSIVPDCLHDSNGPRNGNGAAHCGNGSLLTIGFQMMANNVTGGKLTMESVNTVKSLIAQTLHDIRTNLGCS